MTRTLPRLVALALASLTLMSSPGLVLAEEAMVAGEVQKVDESAGKVTIKHSEIPNLQMEAMTMVFKAGDGVAVASVKTGDKIKFHAEKVNGQLTVTKIEKSK